MREDGLTMSSAACTGCTCSGASGIDASVSLPLCRKRGAMTAAVALRRASSVGVGDLRYAT